MKPLVSGQALLFVTWTDDTRKTLESVTVFIPYSTQPPDGYVGPDWYPTRFESAFGPVDIVYSHGASYKVTSGERSKSGFTTGTALPNETFSIHPSRHAAVDAAKPFKFTT